MALTETEKQELVGYLPVDMRSSEMLDAWIRGAEFRVSRQYFGPAYVYALSRVVAHKATLESMAGEGVAGPISSKREGDIAVEYSSGGGSSNGDWGMTAYGREYQELLAQYKPNPGITRGICIGGLDGGDRIQSLL